MTETKGGGGAEVIRSALRARMKKGHLGLTATNHTLAIATLEAYAVGTLKALPVEDLKKLAADLFPNCRYVPDLDMMQSANHGVAPQSIGIGPQSVDLRRFDPATVNASAPLAATPSPERKKRGGWLGGF